MQRRTFLGAMPLAVVTPPYAAEAQQAAKVPRMDYIRAQAPPAADIEPFRQGLPDHGYVEGMNIVVEYRWADGSEQGLHAIVAGRDSCRLTEVQAVAEALNVTGLKLPVRGPDRFAATFVDEILRGARPGDLPVEQPTNLELVVNLKTATALGLTIPQSVLGRADEIIQ